MKTEISKENCLALLSRLASKELRKAELFEGEYVLFENGRLFSIKSGKEMKIGTTPQGYSMAYLWHNGISHKIPLHRLLGKHFIPNPEGKPEINHKNGIRNDNRLENLEWCTSSENKFHSHRVLGHKGIKMIEFKGQKKPLKLWSEQLGINFKTLHNRIYMYGMSVEVAFTRPVGRWASL